ncbi:MAG: DEAD/DEAH box helicase family protein, partial [Proteobacteria bacterium]|nr:DEAD/DEAH box helicase family protein [Pseudomonadota bacterium]
MPGQYSQLTAAIEYNQELRIPQRDGYLAIQRYFSTDGAENEVGLVLPVGCGKSGLISIAPFALGSNRTLVVAPYVKIAEQLYECLDPTSDQNCFYISCNILGGDEFPEPVEIRGTRTNRGDLDDADVVVTNIDQLQGSENRWLRDLPNDFFDLIVFDEGHHAVAQSWETLKNAFPEARIINFSATPRRADGQLMPGTIIYSYSVQGAINEGYIKNLRALVLNPNTLRFVRREDGEEIQVELDEVIR